MFNENDFVDVRFMFDLLLFFKKKEKKRSSCTVCSCTVADTKMNLYCSVNKTVLQYVNGTAVFVLWKYSSAAFSFCGNTLQLLFLFVKILFRYLFFLWKYSSDAFSFCGSTLQMLFLFVKILFCYFFLWKYSSATFSFCGNTLQILFLFVEVLFRCFFFL